MNDLASNPQNTAVLAYLDGLSCHSDLRGALSETLEPYQDLEWHCPDKGNYAWVAVSTARQIFAIAVGMNSVCFRLSADDRKVVIKIGAAAMPELGNDWVCLPLWRESGLESLLQELARNALDYLAETTKG